MLPGTPATRPTPRASRARLAASSNSTRVGEHVRGFHVEGLGRSATASYIRNPALDQSASPRPPPRRGAPLPFLHDGGRRRGRAEEPGHQCVQLGIGGHLDRFGHQVGGDVGRSPAPFAGAEHLAAAAASSVSFDLRRLRSTWAGSASNAFSTSSHRVPASSVVPVRNALVWAPVSVIDPVPMARPSWDRSR